MKLAPRRIGLLSPIRLIPFMARAKGYAGWSSSIGLHWKRSWLIAPSVENVRLPAAIFEESDLQRITGVNPDADSVAAEIAIARSRPGSHDATVAHEVRDVLLSSGHLFTRQGWLRVGTGPVPIIGNGHLVVNLQQVVSVVHPE